MKLLSLDQSSKITGYAIFDNGILIESGILSFSGKIEKRLVKLRDAISELITNENIDEVVFEDIQLQTNVHDNVATFKALAQVQGMLKVLLEDLAIPYNIYLASTWRHILGIAQSKKAAQDYVLVHYNQDLSQDTCDAICLGKAYILKKSSFDWS